MKPLIKLMIVGALVLPAVVMAAKPGGKHGSRGKENNLFVFHTEKDLIGAKIEIFDEGGDLVTAQLMEKRKMIIDFGTVRKGTYTIKVSKGDTIKEFKYTKES